MWYDPDRIANILSMRLMSRRHRVTFDSEGQGEDRNVFVVHNGDELMRFSTSASRPMMTRTT